jgi:hypothetical protein
MRLDRTLAEALRRLRAKAGHSIAFVLLGTALGTMTMLPSWLPRMNEFSLRDAYPRWPHDLLVLLAGAVLVTAALRLFMERAAELAQRPGRFAVLVLLGAALATVLMWSLILVHKHALPGDVPLEEYLYTWWQTLLWGGLVGWIYVLNLQRTEDREQLDALQLRRATLARELARSQLGAARAQIDPAMVARVLREVHRRYHSRPEQAAVLLDQLIGYLRLAMQRVQQSAPAAEADAALARALEALHQTEYDETLPSITEPGAHDDADLSATH